jgi:hypothetical protein
MTFIGPKPKDTPKYASPFTASSGVVEDAHGNRVVSLDLPTYEDDVAMAEAIRDALNEKFCGEPENAEVFNHPGANPDESAWVVVNGLSYYRMSKGQYMRSVLTPAALRTHKEIVLVGRTSIDPKDLVGVEGRE